MKYLRLTNECSKFHVSSVGTTLTVTWDGRADISRYTHFGVTEVNVSGFVPPKKTSFSSFTCNLMAPENYNPFGQVGVMPKEKDSESSCNLYMPGVFQL